jgi:hypothetical protein
VIESLEIFLVFGAEEEKWKIGWTESTVCGSQFPNLFDFQDYFRIQMTFFCN